MVEVLSGFGFASFGFTEKDFLKEDAIIQLGVEPIRIDILMSLSGLEFSEAYKNREVIDAGGLITEVT